ncbi:MAG: TonB family protein [Verrucomicrobiales bacterium]|nr:TonB family protein [Verrucomicrobiales bacterium]
MKRDWLNLLKLASKKFCLFPIIALFAFGCAAQKPAAATRTETNSTNEYLVYALNTKKAYLEVWDVGTNVVLSAGPVRVKAKVLIDKDGKVESAKIVEFSGNQPVDESVQKTLDQVKSVQPFETGATDEQRTFVINFELKPKSQ